MTPVIYFSIGFILLTVSVLTRGMDLHNENDPTFYISWFFIWPIWLILFIPALFFTGIFELGKKFK